MDTSIYREQIIDLYEHPLNYGAVEKPNFTYEAVSYTHLDVYKRQEPQRARHDERPAL